MISLQNENIKKPNMALFKETYIAMWPDLAKFCHVNTMLQNLGHFEQVHLVFGKILTLILQILTAIGQIIIFENGQIWNK